MFDIKKVQIENTVGRLDFNSLPNESTFWREPQLFALSFGNSFEPECDTNIIGSQLKAESVISVQLVLCEMSSELSMTKGGASNARTVSELAEL